MCASGGTFGPCRLRDGIVERQVVLMCSLSNASFQIVRIT
jgi:hypothetical protein